MSNDLTARITTNTGGTAAQIRSVTSEVDQLRSKTAASNVVHRDFGKTAASSFRAAHDGARSFHESLKEVGHSLALSEGSLGRAGELMARFSRVSSGGGMALGTFGLALAGVTLAFEAWNKRQEEAIERAGELAKAQDEVTQKIRQATEAANEQSLGQFKSQGEKEKALIGATHDPHAVDRAAAFAKEHGLSNEDAIAGLTQAQHLRRGVRPASAEDRDTATRAALLFQQSGAGTFTEGMNAISSNHLLMRGGGAEQMAANARDVSLGGRGVRGDVTSLMAGIFANTGKPRETEIDINKEENRGGSAVRDRALNGGAAEAARLKAAKEQNPLLEPMLELVRSNQQQEAILRARAQAEAAQIQAGGLSGFMAAMRLMFKDDTTGLFGGGSENLKLRRFHQATAEKPIPVAPPIGHNQ